MFPFALDNELIDNVRNPFTGKKKKIPKDSLVNERKPIDDTQKELILSVAHRSQIEALIMLYCGLRKGEVIALEWPDIDFKEKIISVTKSAVRKDSNHYKITPHTKNGKLCYRLYWQSVSLRDTYYFSNTYLRIFLCQHLKPFHNPLK